MKKKKIIEFYNKICKLGLGNRCNMMWNKNNDINIIKKKQNKNYKKFIQMDS